MIRSIFTILSVLLIFSCKKDQLGGDEIIEGKVIHHNKTITNCTVFLKFNATELPGVDTTMYDAKVRVDKEGYFKFNVYKGKYYLYASGMDPGIAPPYIVVGGQAVKLRSKETVSLTLSVSEGD